MGVSFSKPVSAGFTPASDPRPVLTYSSLQFLDLVLIRSQATVSGFGMDSRIVSTIRYGALGLQLAEVQSLEKYDRVGLIQLPSFVEKHEYTSDNVSVTEATYFGIQTRSLRQVMDEASEVAIRRVRIGKEQQQDQEEHKAAAAAGGGGGPGGDAAPSDVDGDDDDDGDDARLACLQQYYQFTGPVINRAYGQCMDKLEAMFRFVTASFRAYELQPQEAERMDEMLERFMVEFIGLDGKATRGIPFASLLPLFREVAAHPAQLRNTFSDSEIFELVGAFTQGDDRVSLSNSGFISKTEFLHQWRASLERTLPLRRVPREILSGAFVSQAWQTMGLLPQSEDAYYLPMDFAMQDRPDEWQTSKKAADLQQEQQARSDALDQEAKWNAHRPKLTGPHSAAALAAATAASSAAAANANPGDSSSSSSHFAASSPLVNLSLSIDSASREGYAIQRLHAHGRAQVGWEQRVEPPPPSLLQVHKGGEDE